MIKYCQFNCLIVFLLLLSGCGNFSKFSKIGVPESDDYKLFASRKIQSGNTAFHFFKHDQNLNLGKNIEVDSRKIDATAQPLDEFLKEYKTLSLLIIRNDTILHEYYDQSISDTSIVSSFSVAKAFISGLVGIAIAEGRIQGTETKITEYFPELQNQGFEAVTIDHLLDHTSGIHYKETLVTDINFK